MHRGYTRSWRIKYSGKSASRGLLYVGAMDWLVGNANWNDGWIDGERVQRGQIAVGRKQLSLIWKVSEQTVRTILHNLETDGFLTTQSTNRGTIVTITNFGIYQSAEEADQPANQPAINQPSTTIKEFKKEEKEITDVISKEKPVKRFIKPSVEEVAAYCRERNNGVDAQYFWDFYESKGWYVGRSPMRDWRCAVRTWEKNNRTSGSGQKPGWSKNERGEDVGDLF